MRSYQFIALSLLAFTCFTGGCQRDAAHQQTFKIANEVVSAVGQNNIEQAFDILKKYWPLSSAEVDNLKAHTIKQREVVQSRYGKPISIEYIKSSKVGDSMIQHTFIEKFEHHALKWQLSFYKPADKWIINSVYWDDKLSELYGQPD